MKKIFYGLFVLMLLLSLISCDDTAPKSGDDQQEEALPVKVIEVYPVDLPISAETVAQTEGAKEIEIRPRVGGIVIRRLYTEGTAVIAGQPLFKIDAEPFQHVLRETQAEFLEQGVRTLRAKREEERHKHLVEQNFVSQRAYEGTVAEHAIEDAALRAAKARLQQAELNLKYTTVTAPIDGVAGHAQVSEGALVSANSSLLTTMTQLSPIWVRFSFSDNELVRFGGRLNEQNVKEVVMVLPDGSEYQQKGQINFAASEIDPMLGTQLLRATFENDDHQILPGQFVRIRVMARQTSEAFLVPQVSVLTSDLGRYVYVVNTNHEAEERSVTVGDWIGKDWVVLEGLNAGERVIIDNIIKLSAGEMVAPLLVEKLSESHAIEPDV